MIEKTHALAFLKAADLPRAMACATKCVEQTPGDADAVIELANAFRDKGHQHEADAFFARATALYSQLCTDHPDSGPVHNLYAWALRTHREPKEAIAHARRAVELEPSNTASLDTLAEALFVDGQVKEAIATIQKCIDLEPDEPHHRAQMRRFRGESPQPPSVEQ